MMYTLSAKQAGSDVGCTMVQWIRNSRVRFSWDGEMDICMWFPRRIK